jgi:hypothetical protein
MGLTEQFKMSTANLVFNTFLLIFASGLLASCITNVPKNAADEITTFWLLDDVSSMPAVSQAICEKYNNKSISSGFYAFNVSLNCKDSMLRAEIKVRDEKIPLDVDFHEIGNTLIAMTNSSLISKTDGISAGSQLLVKLSLFGAELELNEVDIRYIERIAKKSEVSCKKFVDDESGWISKECKVTSRNLSRLVGDQKFWKTSKPAAK